MSKMGFSTLRGYRGAQIFAAVGLGPDLTQTDFPAIVPRVGGIGRAGDILDNWELKKDWFVKVFPMEYRRVLGAMPKADAATPRREHVATQRHGLPAEKAVVVFNAARYMIRHITRSNPKRGIMHD